jgi:proline dehydrogenase
METAALEQEIARVGREIAEAFPGRGRHPLRALDDRAAEVAARDAELRAALFRFVDVTPACRSLDDLARHLIGFLDEVPEGPGSLEGVRRLGATRAGRSAVGALAAAGVRHMAHRFIVGESPGEVMGLIRSLWDRGIGVSLDLLGEATLTAAEADRYAGRCADALRELAAAVPEPNLSVKVSALTPLLRPEAPGPGKRDAAGRLRALLRLARDLDAHLHVDMESLDTRDAVLELLLELLDEEELSRGPSAGLVLQAYLRDSPDQLERVLDWAGASRRTPPVVVRLVKGAYWDHEVVEARQHGWPSPVFEDKAECDRNFEALTRRLLDARPAVRVAVGSHNLRSISHAVAYNRLTGGGGADLELQVLRGLGDDLQDALAARGLRVRTYCPVGDLVAGMAYLVRRLLENTANESFLAEARDAPLEQLLAAP